MGNFPGWVLRHRRPGCELRYINGHYYLYEVSSQWDKINKRTKKITGPIIGKITPAGELIPSKRQNPQKKKIAQNPLLLTDKIAIKEFGLTHFFLRHLKPAHEQLKIHFPHHWELILGVAYCRLYRQLAINQMPLHLHYSFLSEEFKEVSFTEKNISLALRDIGRNREAVVNFMKWDVPEDEYVLIDLTTLPSRSKNGAFAQVGYNNRRDYNGQINLLYIFGNQSLKSIFYRLVPGNIRELSAFLLTMEESNMPACILVMDKGFYSAKHVKYMTKNNFNFICPLKRDTKLATSEGRQKLFNKEDANYFEYMGRMIWHVDVCQPHCFDRAPPDLPGPLDANRLKKFSIKSVIERLTLVRKARINGQWFDTEVIKANVKLFQEIGFPVT